MTTPFESDLAEAVAIANRAPSSHNSQPWALAYATSEASRAIVSALPFQTFAHSSTNDDEQYIVLALDRQRELTTLAAHRVEMYVSCGIFLEILLGELSARSWVVTGYCGNDAESETMLSGTAVPSTWFPLAVVRLARAEASEPKGSWPLAAAARERVTNRAPYRPEPVPKEKWARISTPKARIATRDDDRDLLFINDPEQIADVGRFVAQHAGIDFSHAEAWAETYKFIRFGEADAEAAEDGFAITQLFGPLGVLRRTMYRVALAPQTMSLLKHVGYPNVIARGLGSLVGATPALVAFSFETDAPSVSQQIAGGGRIASFWLSATIEHLALHPVSVVLQHDDIRHDLETRLGLSGRIYFLTRLGTPSVTFPLTKRRKEPWTAVLSL